MKKRKFHIGWVYEISDTAPQVDTPRNGAMKLQNEIKDFVRSKDGIVKIKVVG